MFPLYRATGKPWLPLSDFQRAAITQFKAKLASGEYRLETASCLCGNPHPDGDTVLTEQDRYGLPIASLLCAKCGLVRSGEVLDEASNLDFYSHEYRGFYVGEVHPPDAFFQDQEVRGRQLLALVQDQLAAEPIREVLEVGCGAGGILHPFHAAGYRCVGGDFDRNYLDYGIARGMDLRFGDVRTTVADASCDLLILCHVMEHFRDPIGEIQALARKIKPGGFFLIEVPGIFNVARTYYEPITYFQNAHVYNYYRDYLAVFFRALGFQVVFSSEKCRFILKKPDDWQERPIETIYDASLGSYPARIRRYFLACYLERRLGLNPHQWSSRLRRVMEKCGIPLPAGKAVVR